MSDALTITLRTGETITIAEYNTRREQSPEYRKMLTDDAKAIMRFVKTYDKIRALSKAYVAAMEAGDDVARARIMASRDMVRTPSKVTKLRAYEKADKIVRRTGWERAHDVEGLRRVATQWLAQA